MRKLAIAAVLVLSGCGVDGPPIAPVDKADTGVRISGEATMGVIFTP